MFDWKKYESDFLKQKDDVFNWIKSEFSKLQVGRANPSILDAIKVNCYDELMNINQIANISIPEPRVLIIKPYDKNIIKDIASAINAANIGINPQVDPDLIRLTFPAPTEESRKLTVKKAKTLIEDAKIRVRLIRQNIQDDFKKQENVLEDDKKHFQKELDAITKKVNSELDELFNSKEKELMKI